MEKIEFENKRSALVHQLSEIENEYAVSNALFSIGDIISSKKSTIVIDKITACKRYSNDYLPVVIYGGRRLTKQKTIRKDNKTAIIPEDSIIKI